MAMSSRGPRTVPDTCHRKRASQPAGTLIESQRCEGDTGVNLAYTWTWPALVLAAGILIGVILVTVVGIVLLGAQRRREQRAAALQERLAGPIARELGLAGVAVL